MKSLFVLLFTLSVSCASFGQSVGGGSISMPMPTNRTGGNNEGQLFRVTGYTVDYNGNTERVNLKLLVAESRSAYSGGYDISLSEYSGTYGWMPGRSQKASTTSKYSDKEMADLYQYKVYLLTSSKWCYFNLE